jgi:cobalt-zinc-cadmium efflux system membrane fusion protein
MKNVIWAAAIAVVIAGPRSYAADDISISAAQHEILGIQTTALQMTSEFSGSRIPARVVIPPSNVRVVSAPQAGLITTLYVAVGDEVGEGTLLARIQSPDLVALQRDYLQKLTEQQLAKSQMDRDQALYKEGIIAERRYLETKSRYIQAAAALDERTQALQLAGMDTEGINQLRQTHKLSSTLVVKATLNGVVLERMSDTGQRVQATAPLFRIANLEELWLDMRIPLSDAQGLSPGSLVTIPGYPSEARLTKIGHEVDPDNQTVLLRGEVTKGAQHLRPGQFLEAQLSSASSAHQYRIPSEAVVRSGEKTVVFVQTQQGFKATPVRLLSQQDGYSVITGELNGDERVAIAGVAAIKAAWQGLGGGE